MTPPEPYQVTILAAGMGSRLGRPHPKPLTLLASGETILARQLRLVRGVLGQHARISLVVGYKLDMVMEHQPDLLYVYNEEFDRTNTSKSLLKALRLSGSGGVLWLNGDVVFDSEVLKTLAPLMDKQCSFVSVNEEAVGDEEVKYTLGPGRLIRQLSKEILNPTGEAVGINFVAAADKQHLISALENCQDDDYFERAIESTIEEGLVRWQAISIAGLFAIEVDCEADLVGVNAELTRRPRLSADAEAMEPEALCVRDLAGP